MTSTERLQSVSLILREHKARATEQLQHAIRVAAHLLTPAQWVEYATFHRLQDAPPAALEKHIQQLLQQLHERTLRLEPVTISLRIMGADADRMLRSEPAVRDAYICKVWSEASAKDSATFPTIRREHFHACRKVHDASAPLICRRACVHVGTGQTTKQAAADAVRKHMTNCCGMRLRAIQPPHKRLCMRQARAEEEEKESDDDDEQYEQKAGKRKRVELKQTQMHVTFTPVFVATMLLPRFGAALKQSALHGQLVVLPQHGAPAATSVEREAKQLAPVCEHVFEQDKQCTRYRAFRALVDHTTGCMKQPSEYMEQYKTVLGQFVSRATLQQCMQFAVAQRKS